MRLVLGIDIGSASSKGICLGDQGALASFECPSGGDFKLTADRIREALLSQTGISVETISRTVATGYGSKLVSFADEIKSDITCHAKGVSSLLPSVRTVMDVGDLYTKVFRIDGNGGVHEILAERKVRRGQRQNFASDGEGSPGQGGGNR